MAGALAAGSGVIYVTHLEPVPITGRQHLVLCSLDRERSLGKQAAAQVLSEFRGAVLPPSHPAARRVARVAARLVEALGEDERLRKLPHLQGMTWRFTVVDSPQVNAFVVPGGHAFVFTGLLRAFPEDDALAMVLAHETAHVVARHSAEKISQALVGTLLKVALATLTGVGAGDTLVELGLNLPFSRRAEHEADAIGIMLMARACFDPGAAPGVFERLGHMHGGGREPPAWLSTHPASAERVRSLQAASAAAQRAYLDAGCAEARAALAHAGLAQRRSGPIQGA